MLEKLIKSLSEGSAENPHPPFLEWIHRKKTQRGKTPPANHPPPTHLRFSHWQHGLCVIGIIDKIEQLHLRLGKL